MTRWISTSEVLAMLGVSRALLSELMGLTREAALDPPWTHYGGTGRRARYRWASGDVDTWWKEICAWRQSKSAAKGGESAGETRTAERTPGSAPPIVRPRSSSSKSRKPTRSASDGRLKPLSDILQLKAS